MQIILKCPKIFSYSKKLFFLEKILHFFSSLFCCTNLKKYTFLLPFIRVYSSTIGSIWLIGLIGLIGSIRLIWCMVFRRGWWLRLLFSNFITKYRTRILFNFVYLLIFYITIIGIVPMKKRCQVMDISVKGGVVDFFCPQVFRIKLPNKFIPCILYKFYRLAITKNGAILHHTRI